MEIAKNELMEYMKKCIDVETSLVQQEEIKTQYEQQREKEEPVFEWKQEESVVGIGGGSFGYGLTTFFCVMALVAIILLCLGASSKHLGSISEDQTQVIICLLIMGSLAIAGINGIVRDNRKLKKIKANNEKIILENKEFEKKFDNDFRIWKEENEHMTSLMRAPQTQTRDVLNQLYALDYIYPKYQNLPALTSMYEYFMTGRCDSLTGPHGAYNLYEDEVRKDMVISQLNSVLENLEKIRMNQYMLYQQLVEIKNNSIEIAEGIAYIAKTAEQIARLSAVNAYYQSVEATNSGVIAYLSTMSALRD